jgi:hypothetical protein
VRIQVRERQPLPSRFVFGIPKGQNARRRAEHFTDGSLTARPGGTNPVQEGRTMRHFSFIGIAAFAIAVAACDQRPLPRIGIIVEPGDSTGVTPGPLSIIPGRAEIVVGGTVQFRTNAPIEIVGQVQWISLQPDIAPTTPTGLVQGLRVGTATIVARYSFDTTTFGTAVVVVNPGTGSGITR